MNKLNTSLMGLALTALISSQALAATTAPETHEPKPSATSGPSPAPATTVAPAPVSPTPAPAATTTAPAMTPAAAPEQAAAKEPCKIGYIDMTKIGLESTGGKSATAAIKSKSAKLKAKIEAKAKQLEKEKASIEAKLDTLSGKERAAKAKEFQKKVEEYQKLVRSSQEEMQKMEEKLTSDLYKKIKKATSSYAKSHGYSAIVEEKALLFASDALEPKDLTEEITAVVNEKQAGK